MITNVIGNASTTVMARGDNQSANLADVGNGSRIKAERQRLGMSQADLARRIGITQPAVKKIEAGQTTKSKWEPELLEALKQESERQVKGAVYRAPPPLVDTHNRVKVYSSAEGGDGALLLSTDPISYESRPPELFDVDDGYGIVIEGESMAPAYRPGDTAWVNPRLGPRRDEDYVFYTADPANERAMVKRLVGGLGAATEWMVEQYNPPKQFKLPKGQWPKIHRIVGRRNRP